EKEPLNGLMNHIFKVPQGIFYNGLEANRSFFIVVPYTGNDVEWANSSSGGGETWSHNGSSWSSLSGVEMHYTLYNHSLDGDGLSNLEEYIVCTDPKNRNSDIDHLGHNDDGLTDGDEVKTYFGQGGTGTGEDEVLARIDVEEGALSFNRLLSGITNTSKIFYNELLTGDEFVEYEYVENGTEYSYTVWDCVQVFKLRDGSDVTKVVEGSDTYLIVWDTLCLDEMETIVEDNTTTIFCDYILFIEDQSFTANYSIDLAYRGQDIYFSEPCSYDSDWDGILDGLEIRWNESSDGSFTGRELSELGTDTIYNVRDRDSDNDGIEDGDEIGWNETNDGQGLDENDDRENMIDPDSDGDGIWDGWEREPFSDHDHDGLVNMEDPDSDGDGLCDGWVNNYVWDPLAESGSGRFVNVTLSSTFTFSTGNSTFDWWEGEDQNRNGILDENETDPLNSDTDNDQFWDGFDVKNSNGDWKRGEMYIKGASIQGYEYQRFYY
ncbi:MAG: hypothetical protein QCI82_11255, partial [Candidatus Thermoplasmatota archaeon]|nr:hypothetical protein [Candidatus Thermoplasmatota archaeon]